MDIRDKHLKRLWKSRCMGKSTMMQRFNVIRIGDKKIDLIEKVIKPQTVVVDNELGDE